MTGEHITNAPNSSQQKNLEIEFFESFGYDGGYDRFHESSYRELIKYFIQHTHPKKGEVLFDFGCGTGAFTYRMKSACPELTISGLDLSKKCIERASSLYPSIRFLQGDLEDTKLESSSVDIACLFGVLHHFPNFSPVAKEINRILKPGGRFFALDPHHLNPFFWLYRSKTSPFYSGVGVTPNERLLTKKEIVNVFSEVGLDASTNIISGLTFLPDKTLKSRFLVGIFNQIDKLMAITRLSHFIGAWIISWGTKK